MHTGNPSAAAVLALLAGTAALAGCGGDGAAARPGGEEARAPAAAPAPIRRAAPALEAPPARGLVYDRWTTVGTAEGLPSPKVLAVTCGAEIGRASCRERV